MNPKYGGNIGATARAMANFGYDRLVLVAPEELDVDDTWKRALHARDIVKNAPVLDTMDEALALVDYSVATASDLPDNERKHTRDYLSLGTACPRLHEHGGHVGLVFGREDDGLYNDEVAKCDLVVTIPTHDAYRSMNLSHAVAVFLYELSRGSAARPRARRASTRELDTFMAYFDATVDAIEMRDHRRFNTGMAMRRLLGRAMPTKWEYHRLMGVFSGVLKRLKHPLPPGSSADGDDADADDADAAKAGPEPPPAKL